MSCYVNIIKENENSHDIMICQLYIVLYACIMKIRLVWDGSPTHT